MSNKTFKPTEKVMLSLTLPDKETNLFVRANIYNSAGVQEATAQSLPHLANGTYQNSASSLTISTEGNYLVQYEVFDDAGFSQANEKYGNAEETIRITDFEDRILTEIPDNILLDDDARLDQLNSIPDLARSAELGASEQAIKDEINDNIDTGEGRTV
jgi:hypothetical protein